MRKFLSAFLLFAGLSFATNFTCTSNLSGGTGNWSAAGTWSSCNSGIPDNGRGGGNTYFASITSGDTVHLDSSASGISVGTNASQTAHGIHVVGTGKLIVDQNVSFTAAGDNAAGCTATPNAMAVLVDQNATWTINQGATISVNAGSATTGCVLVQGTVLADATGGTAITFTVPAANIAWNNVQTSTASGVPVGSTATFPNWAYNPISGAKLQIWVLNQQFIANSGGTGLGSCGNTSLILTHTAGDTLTEVCPPALTTNSATWDPFAYAKTLSACTSCYIVDYQAGMIYANIVSLSTTFNYTFDYLTGSLGPTFIVGPGQTSNSGIFRNVTWNYWGASQFNNPFVGTLFFNGQFFGTGSSTTGRTAEVTNNTFFACKIPISIKESGASADSAHPLLFTGNNVSVFDSQGYPAFQLTSVADGVSEYWHIQFNNNLIEMPGFSTSASVMGVRSGNGSTGALADDVELNNNYVRGDGLTFSTGPNMTSCADCQVNNNIVAGLQRAPGYGVTGMHGTSGHPYVINGNIFFGVERCIQAQSFNTVTNNQCWTAGHHGMISSVGAGTTAYITNVIASGNIFVGSNFNVGPSINAGYNGLEWLDNESYFHNTMIQRGSSGATNGTINLGDSDSSTTTVITHMIVRDNLVAMLNGASGNSGIGRTAVTANVSNMVGVDVLQNNALGFGDTAYYGGVNRGAIFTLSGNNYNQSGSRNVKGTSVWNPSYSSNQTTGALKLTFTSTSNQTLQWSINNGTNYGTAVQLNWGGSGTSYTISTSTADVTPATLSFTKAYTLVLSGTPGFTTAPNVPSTCPTGNFILMTSGTASGQVAAIVNTTANNTIVVVPPHVFGTSWVFTPAATDTFVIIKSDITLADSPATGTVEVMVDPRTLPGSTQTDTSINITMTDTNNVNPQIVSPVYSFIAGQYAPTNPVLCTAASDGTTIGALACQPGRPHRKR